MNLPQPSFNVKGHVKSASVTSPCSDSVPKAPGILFSHLGPAQHSLRLLQETSLGKTLAAVGSTRAGLAPLRFSKPGAHGLAADLATGGPTGPPGIKITHNPENQIRHVGD